MNMKAEMNGTGEKPRLCNSFVLLFHYTARGSAGCGTGRHMVDKTGNGGIIKQQENMTMATT